MPNISLEDNFNGFVLIMITPYIDSPKYVYIISQFYGVMSKYLIVAVVFDV